MKISFNKFHIFNEFLLKFNTLPISVRFNLVFNMNLTNVNIANGFGRKFKQFKLWHTFDTTKFIFKMRLYIYISNTRGTLKSEEKYSRHNDGCLVCGLFSVTSWVEFVFGTAKQLPHEDVIVANLIPEIKKNAIKIYMEFAFQKFQKKNKKKIRKKFRKFQFHRNNTISVNGLGIINKQYLS